MIGNTLSHYKIIEKLGRVGMGEVYLAEDSRLNRKVALKILPQHLSDKAELRERFEREARAVSSLNHPHICTLYDIGEQDGIHYLVMEHLVGETLEARLAKGPLPLEQTLEYAIQIADALDKAHRQGVVHRDLKPGNIMLVKSGAKLLDFGLAKLQATETPTHLSALPTEQANLTAEGTILGTLQYMAPEQLEAKEADSRTDIFAFGAVVYEMATGSMAFKGNTTAVVFNEILTKTPTSPVRLNPDVPDGLENTINRSLEKDPELRYQTASDLRSELKRLKRDSSGESVSAAVPAATPAKRSYLWPVVGGGVVVLLLLALLLPLTVTVPTEVIDSIAVLPFENRSGDPELEYLSDGIAEGIINRLSQLSGLNKVISSASLRGYKGKEVNPQTVTQEVDVRAVVIGSLTQLGENIRINVELIDGENNSTVWGETYTRPRSAVYELEETLSKEIADALGIQLSGEEESSPLWGATYRNRGSR